MSLNLSFKLNIGSKVKDADGKPVEVCAASNLAHLFPVEDLDRIGTMVWEGYDRDKSSRANWERRMQSAMDLALQLQKEKSFPWPGAANVAFPLITIAAMQFHSRAYPALIQGPDVVKCRVPGPDAGGQATDRAMRVGRFMSYQVLEEDQPWEEQHDRLLLHLPIVGCAFVKTYNLPRGGHNVSELVPASNLVLDYYAKSVEDCGRKTQTLCLYRNDIYTKCKSGTWVDITNEAWYKNPYQSEVSQEQVRMDQRTGQTPGEPDPYSGVDFLEQHTWLDLDDDGYAEPYVVTVEARNKKVVRILARWERPEDVEYIGGEVLRIRATEYYTKYGLIPSPDGSIYDLGFGILLGPLNESVNTLVNQLLDLGTMQVVAGGFLGRGVRMRGGAFTIQPFGWQRVDSTGDDLRKNIVELPVREPSNVLFTLLTFLVNYCQRISGSTDMLAGENPGQNTPKGTAEAMVEQGMKIYSALFKRVWRSMKEEFCKLYVLNARYLPISRKFGNGGEIAREDFLADPSECKPAADPHVTSNLMRLQQAGAIADRAQIIPGYNKEITERRLLEAMMVDGIDAVYPGPDKVPPLINPKVQIEQIRAQLAEKKLQADSLMFVAELQEQHALNLAQIAKLLAEVRKLEAETATMGTDENGDGAVEAAIEAKKVAIEAFKAQDEHVRGMLELALKNKEIESGERTAQTQAKAAAQRPTPAK